MAHLPAMKGSLASSMFIAIQPSGVRPSSLTVLMNSRTLTVSGESIATAPVSSKASAPAASMWSVT